ncbi:hypothetical protein ACTZ91_004646 [Vibrio parahaemolyticus]|uniref:Uncharacterized protein n=1 Tax=Vibrio parahaemolyticus TaxID=670 RepID=A0AAW3ISS4_VIBPH|nr:hypothetical protein [Vibrio parahaemolyticus]KOF37427.1 hypothetical protein ACX04_02065 [Vibrio parahaemolyticus]KOY22612.1 hypothetical protein ACX05_21290 [Vibrio parahaemolyticus]ODW95045.1 hypothetical protein BBM90_12975 [Vibrio parahaemolyticus]OTW12972.1 hypothetical protein BA743_23170 [Vibrio parahaemolyticus]OTW26095.1 hypothetical protein BA744_11595 [Vibrio parahaemolyticus]
MEYAEEYTKKEKGIRFSAFFLLGLAAIALHKFWFLSLVSDFVERPRCYEFLGLNGADYLWDIVFVGLPFSLFIVFAFMLPVGMRGVKEGRYPPKSMKVYKPTVVKRGAVAYLKSGTCILAPVIALLFVIWGYHQVDNMPPLDAKELSPHLCQS